MKTDSFKFLRFSVVVQKAVPAITSIVYLKNNVPMLCSVTVLQNVYVYTFRSRGI